MKKILACTLLLTSIQAYAITGEEIIEMVKEANRDFGSEVSEMVLVLHDAGKVIAERHMKSKSLELKGGDVSIKSMIEFVQPTDVKGTKLLTWLQRKDDKSQWIYLPALKKTRRILSGNQNSSFMGSEFTYEDIGGQETSRYNYKLIDEKKMNNDIIWTIEQTAKGEKSKKHELLTIPKSYLSPTAIEFYNERNEKHKISHISDFKKYTVGKKSFYRPLKITMKNLATGKESTFQWKNRNFGEKVREGDFNSNTLDQRK